MDVVCFRDREFQDLAVKADLSTVLSCFSLLLISRDLTLFPPVPGEWRRAFHVPFLKCLEYPTLFVAAYMCVLVTFFYLIRLLAIYCKQIRWMRPSTHIPFLHRD